MFLEREYPLDFLQRVSRKLLLNMRKIIEDTSPYTKLRDALEREFFDPFHSAKRFERSHFQ